MNRERLAAEAAIDSTDLKNDVQKSVKRIILTTRICSALCLAALLSTRAAVATEPALASMDWSVQAPHSLVKEPSSRQAVEELLQLGDTYRSNPSLCSFTFADLRQTGTLSLVVGYDSSGRGFCNDIDIVDRTTSGLESGSLPPAAIGPGEDVSKLIKDVNGDGRLEIVINMAVGGYQGSTHCGLEWPVVFAWTGTGYADVSSQFKGFYRQALQTLTGQHAAASASIPGSHPQMETFQSQSADGDGINVRARVIRPKPASAYESACLRESGGASGVDCQKAEAAKIERFLGISPDAGMGDAIKWSESSDPSTREFSAGLFADIGTSEAMDHLKTLTADSDRSVAEDSKVRLKAMQRGQISTYAVELTPIANVAATND
jgi:hypothetical protein